MRRGGRGAQGYTIQNGWKRIPERGHFVARRETQSTQASVYVAGAAAGKQRGVSDGVSTLICDLHSNSTIRV